MLVSTFGSRCIQLMGSWRIFYKLRKTGAYEAYSKLSKYHEYQLTRQDNLTQGRGIF